VDFLAVLLGDNVTISGACVSAQDDSILEDYSGDGCASLGGCGRLVAILGENVLISGRSRRGKIESIELISAKS
jgi:hypothetical protein